MIRFFVTFVVLIASALTVLAARNALPETLDEALVMLDRMIERRQEFIGMRQAEVDSLSSVAAGATPDRKLQAMFDVASAYRTFNVDSALHYYAAGREYARSRGDSIWLMRFSLAGAALMPVSGIIKEEVDFYDSIDHVQLPRQVLADYYLHGSRLFFALAPLYKPNVELQTRYARRALVYNDSAMNHITPGTPMWAVLQAQSHYVKGERTLAIATLNDLVESLPMEDNYFGRAANMLAAAYGARGRERDREYYLALSAISDIMGATLEGTSLMELGMALYDKGDTERAYRYLLASIDNAADSGARMRALDSTIMLPYIAKSAKEKDRRWIVWSFVLIVVLAFAIVSLVIVLGKLRRDMGKLHALRQRLSDSNTTKDAYIGQFLRLSSVSMNRLEEFNRLAARKIAAKQIDDLYSLVRSGKVLEEQSKVFYEIFDDAFLHTYPTFVQDFNNLLQPDKRLELTEPGRLNTELRIIAFMKLGLEDSNQIARFLNLSLNTVYTYRNKLKSRAINRDTFETDVINIGRIY